MTYILYSVLYIFRTILTKYSILYTVHSVQTSFLVKYCRQIYFYRTFSSYKNIVRTRWQKENRQTSSYTVKPYLQRGAIHSYLLSYTVDIFIECINRNRDNNAFRLFYKKTSFIYFIFFLKWLRINFWSFNNKQIYIFWARYFCIQTSVEI